jgi:hypothetical protein
MKTLLKLNKQMFWLTVLQLIIDVFMALFSLYAAVESGSNIVLFGSLVWVWLAVRHSLEIPQRLRGIRTIEAEIKSSND